MVPKRYTQSLPTQHTIMFASWLLHISGTWIETLQVKIEVIHHELFTAMLFRCATYDMQRDLDVVTVVVQPDPDIVTN